VARGEDSVVEGNGGVLLLQTQQAEGRTLKAPAQRNAIPEIISKHWREGKGRRTSRCYMAGYAENRRTEIDRKANKKKGYKKETKSQRIRPW